MSGREPRTGHWADLAAEDVLSAGRAPVISTGISPSGEIHIGNMREILTGDAVHRALQERGVPVSFNFIADNFDPLRRVYPFLDEAKYASLVGCPLSEIPCPCGRHSSYAEHYLEPFLEALLKLQVDVEVERADQLYKSGRMNPWIFQALRESERIAAIISEITGKQTQPQWSPFSPICPDCGRIDKSRVTGFSEEEASVAYACACGSAGVVPAAGGGKLVWRVDWPARWMALEVSVEPFGKDHSTRGGSYESGSRLIREIFGGEPPLPIQYEWIRLAGKGDMSSSKGNVLSIGRILEVVPPEALRYLVLREKPHKSIKFDPGLPLLRLVDELDDETASGRDLRAVELSQAAGFAPVGIAFKHLVVVAQVAGFDIDRTVAILEREGHAQIPRAALAGRLEYARNWLESFAPEELRFSVRETLPAETESLSARQRLLLGRLAEQLRPDMDAETVHNLIFTLAQAAGCENAGQLFQAIYLALLGKPRGPRAGWFIVLLGCEFCSQRFFEASGGQS